VDITVAICTWDRCELLRQTLEQMTKLQIPAGVLWELLVVNNNCTDRTDEVIASYANRLPIKRLVEPKPGQSNARNCAIGHANGDYIIWTDDDVLVDQHWLTAYYDAFNRWPDAAVFGGPIEPWFAEPPPGWLRQVLPHVAGPYAIKDFGEKPIPLSKEPRVVPFGANFAVRASEQAEHLYDRRRGLRPGSSVRGDETNIIDAILSAGGKGWWVPGARVRHCILPERQTLNYIRSWHFGQGELAAQRVCGAKPLWLWRVAVEAELRYRWYRLFNDPDKWIDDLKKSSYWWGHLGIRLFCPNRR
jgi:glycosyltransferase involved in cell wall biosynthesis